MKPTSWSAKARGHDLAPPNNKGGHYHRRRLDILRFYLLRRRAVVAYLLLFLGYVLVQHVGYREALRQKYQPTLLPATYSSDAVAQSQWRGEPDQVPGLWEARDRWRPLGAGCEGDTFIYGESVIKVYRPGGHLRNCIYKPDELSERWPTEIPVSLLLNGLRKTQGDKIPDDVDFVPIQDYFLSPETSDSAARWHLVTPFLKSGSIDGLGKRLRRQKLTHTQLDARFRPSLNRLLGALDAMHTAHGLCHDDVKQDNIFVASFSSANGTDDEETHWLLADPGNARQVSHPYHSSQFWSPDNGQDPDCRVNDVRRLMRSYMKFLRQASAHAADPGRASFDDAFFAAQDPWSRFYWAVVMDDTLARKAAVLTMEYSLRHPPQGLSKPSDERGPSVKSETTPLEDGGPGLGIRSSSLWRARSVEQELSKGMSLSEKWARFFGVAGVPTIPC